MNTKQLKLPIGTSNFRDMVLYSSVYVDQSLLIKEVLDSSCTAILITKPRRWGKTSAQDMLKTFFDIEVISENKWHNTVKSRILFTGGTITLDEQENHLLPLKIASIDDGKYMSKQGKSPVIFISFKDVKGYSINEISSSLITVISNLYLSKMYIYRNLINDQDIESQLYAKKFLSMVNGEVGLEFLKESLKFICHLLRDYHGSKTYVLIDEYDKPVTYLLERSSTLEDIDLIKNIAELISSLLSRVGKDNDDLEKIIMTGIYDTVKKDGNSGFNNFNSYGISDAQFSGHFGFSESDVYLLVEKMKFNEYEDAVKKTIRDWYNGYLIPTNSSVMEHRYAPWAVLNYLNDAQQGFFEPKNYWSQTGAANIIQDLLKHSATESIIVKIILLAQGESVFLESDKFTSILEYNLSSATKTEKLVTYLLFNSGYLTKVKGTDNKYKIPNHEVRDELCRVIGNEIIDHPSKALINALKELKYDFNNHNQLLTNMKILNFSPEEKIKHAIKLIISGDKEGLKELVKFHPSLECEDSRLNFNLMHIGAISGNVEIFSIILKQCKNQFFHDTNKISGLNLADFGYLSGNESITDLMKENKIKTQIGSNAISIAEHVLCSPIVRNSGAILKPALSLLKKISPEKSNGIDFINEIDYSKISKSNYCENYDANQQATKTLPENYSSLEEFESFVIKNGGYVKLIPECNTEEDKLIAQIEIPLGAYGSDTITFGLCGSINDKNEHVKMVTVPVYEDWID